MSERCEVGKRAGFHSNILFSKRVLQHHNPSFMGEICRAALRTPFTREKLIAVVVSLFCVMCWCGGDLFGVERRRGICQVVFVCWWGGGSAIYTFHLHVSS